MAVALFPSAIWSCPTPISYHQPRCWGEYKQCKHCHRLRPRDMFTQRQWSRSSSCCNICADNLSEAASEEALLELADMQVRGELFASQCKSLQCVSCAERRHPDFYEPGLFYDAAARRELTPLALHKRGLSHLIEIDPLSLATCALCRNQ
jgi:hypothetical protein